MHASGGHKSGPVCSGHYYHAAVIPYTQVAIPLRRPDRKRAIHLSSHHNIVQIITPTSPQSQFLKTLNSQPPHSSSSSSSHSHSPLHPSSSSDSPFHLRSHRLNSRALSLSHQNCSFACPLHPAAPHPCKSRSAARCPERAASCRFSSRFARARRLV